MMDYSEPSWTDPLGEVCDRLCPADALSPQTVFRAVRRSEGEEKLNREIKMPDGEFIEIKRFLIFWYFFPQIFLKFVSTFSSNRGQPYK